MNDVNAMQDVEPVPVEQRHARGIRYQGEQQDVQQVLQEYIVRGNQGLERIASHRAILQVQLNALNYVVGNPQAPHDVQARARDEQRNTEQARSQLLQTDGILRRWLAVVQGSLTMAQRRGHHHLVDPVAGPLSRSNPDGLTRIYEALRYINQSWRSQYDLRAMEANRIFLAQHLAYLTPALVSALPPRLCETAPPVGGAGGVLGDAAGLPQAMDSYRRGYYAGWETQARFFANGNPIAGDIHRRRYNFADRSYVIIQAYVPVLTISADARAAVFGATLAGAIAGVLVGGPGGLVAGASASGAGAAKAMRYDAAWQTYYAEYYSHPGAEVPWGWRAFYGWRRSRDIGSMLTIQGQRVPERFPNFADQPESASWWLLMESLTTPRPPAVRNKGICSYRRFDRSDEVNGFDRSGLTGSTEASGVVNVLHDANRLVQNLAAFADAGADGAWSAQRANQGLGTALASDNVQLSCTLR